MEYRKCYVWKCPTVGGQLFRFPVNRPRVEAWKKFCQNPILDNFPLQNLHNSFHICVKHFTMDCFTFPNSGKLLRSAVPSLFPPEASPPAVASASPPASSAAIFGPSTSSPTPSTSSPTPSHSFPIPSTSLPAPLPSSTNDDEPNTTSSFTPEPESSMELPSSSLPTFSSPSSPPVPSSTPLSTTPSTPTLSASLSPVFAQIDNPTTPKRKVRRSLLHSIGMSRLQQLTPRKRVLMDKLRKSQKEIARMRKISVKFKKDLKGMTDITKSDFLRLFEKRLSPSALLLVQSIVKQDRRKPKGRRWTHEEKIMALSLFKKGPKTYRFLRYFIPLPVKSTLVTLLRSIPLRVGLSEEVVSHLGSVVKNFQNEGDKCCALIFDEMSIKPYLSYDSSQDVICGYVDQGSQGRQGIAAKQALVFMVRGIRARWKQPLSFYFSHGSTPATVLVELIKEALAALKSVGFRIITTICDMGASNVKALQLLGADFEHPFFDFEGQRVVTIYDPPHLLKSFRNLFLKHNIRINVPLLGEKKPLVAKWEHLRKLAQDDAAIKYLPLSLFNLTSKHLDPTAYEKMRVDLAVKIFSRHVAAGVHTLVGRNILEIDGLATAEFLMGVDMLFDSMNGSKESDRDKILKQAVTNSSPHLSFWMEMEEKVKSWEFLRKKVVHPPSQKGWLASMRGMRLLWERLGKEGFLHFNTGNINQDPLENFFNLVRQNCGGNHHPNGNQFQAAFKTALINNLVSNHAPGNTQEDGCSLLSNLGTLFLPEQNVSVAPEKKMGSKYIPLPDRKVASIAAVSSHVGNNFLKEHPCSLCRGFLFQDINTMKDIYFSFMYQGLQEEEVCPSESLIHVVGTALGAVTSLLQGEGHNKNLMGIIKPVVEKEAKITGLCCGVHEVEFQNYFVDYISSVGVRKFCVEENKKMQLLKQ